MPNDLRLVDIDCGAIRWSQCIQFNANFEGHATVYTVFPLQSVVKAPSKRICNWRGSATVSGTQCKPLRPQVNKFSEGLW